MIAVDEQALLGGRQGTELRNIAVSTQFAPSGGREFRGSDGRCGLRVRLERVALIEIPIFLGRDERQVRLQETHCHEKRLRRAGLGRLKAADRLIRDQAVAVGRIRHIGAFRGGAARQDGGGRSLAAGCAGLVGGQGIAATRTRPRAPMGHAPRGGVFGVAVADMENFAHRLGAVAVLHEGLGKRHCGGCGLAEVGGQIINAERGGPLAGHQRVARWRTDGLIAKRFFKQHPAFGETIHVGRLDVRVAVAPEQRLQVVHADEQDVRPRCRSGLGGFGGG